MYVKLYQPVGSSLKSQAASSQHNHFVELSKISEHVSPHSNASLLNSNTPASLFFYLQLLRVPPAAALTNRTQGINASLSFQFSPTTDLQCCRTELRTSPVSPNLVHIHSRLKFQASISSPRFCVTDASNFCYSAHPDSSLFRNRTIQTSSLCLKNPAKRPGPKTHHYVSSTQEAVDQQLPLLKSIVQNHL